MIFEEHIAKALLEAAGISRPAGRLCLTADEADQAARVVGPCMLKASLPGRDQDDALQRYATTPAQARREAKALFGRTIGAQTVSSVLVEAVIEAERVFYVAILNHLPSRSPLLLFSSRGGMRLDELILAYPDDVVHLPIDIREGIDDELLEHIFHELGLEGQRAALCELCGKLYDAYRVNDAELFEIGTLALCKDGRLIALECRFVMDGRALVRRPHLAAWASAETATVPLTAGAGPIGLIADSRAVALATADLLAAQAADLAACAVLDPADPDRKALAALLATPGLGCLLISLGGTVDEAHLLVETILPMMARQQRSWPIQLACADMNGRLRADLFAPLEGLAPRFVFDRLEDAVSAAIACSASKAGAAST